MIMTIYYNAFHSPIGAHSSFTLGCLGNNGGLGLELGGPANQSVYVGVETRKGGTYQALPFYAGSEDEAARYDHAKQKTKERPLLESFEHNAITREFSLGTDTWKAGDLQFTIYSLAESVPEPGTVPTSELKRILCPAVVAELTIDNTSGKRDRRAFFGYSPKLDNDALHVETTASLQGLASGQSTGIFTSDMDIVPAMDMGHGRLLAEKNPSNYVFGLGRTGLLTAIVPAGKKKTIRFAICFFRGGQVTTGMPCSYYYNRYYKSLADVAKQALANFNWFKTKAKSADKMLQTKKLNADQCWMMAHAIRSYYGSTQLLEHKQLPVWVVNEGEYRMMNTFDLTVDQLFYEMKKNPWTVKNELDLFTRRYSYTDKLHFPGEQNKYTGGLSFTHDMGVRNHFTPQGYSSYERTDLTGCFSHMTHEQLVNWILCASVYAHGSADAKWLKQQLPVFKRCLTSMVRRDHPKKSERNGIMALDSSRTGNGAEITTYDSLDESLGQSRNNVYIAVKGWAAYLAMQDIFTKHGLPKEAEIAANQARKAATTIASHLNQEGFIPAIMGENCDSKIIPAIEGLVFPFFTGQKAALKDNGEYGDLIMALKAHFTTIFNQNDCLYPDGGWKLSSSADNSWLSKIYLCQFVARKILGFKEPATREIADKAHASWLHKEENLRFAWSDQMRSGVAMGSKYYPRGVTSILWLEE
jgi:hypothetical protein